MLDAYGNEVIRDAFGNEVIRDAFDTELVATRSRTKSKRRVRYEGKHNAYATKSFMTRWDNEVGNDALERSPPLHVN